MLIYVYMLYKNTLNGCYENSSRLTEISRELQHFFFAPQKMHDLSGMTVFGHP